MSHPPKKLLDQVRDTISLKHYSIRTEETCVDWIKRFTLFHGQRHPRHIGTPEIEAFLTHLAVDRVERAALGRSSQHRRTATAAVEQAALGRSSQHRRTAPAAVEQAALERSSQHRPFGYAQDGESVAFNGARRVRRGG